MHVEDFRRDHSAILKDLAELHALMRAGIVERAPVIAETLVCMSAAIQLHLSTEDGYLYPRLVSSADSVVSQLAKCFQLEMGDLARAYAEFAARWNVAARIAAEPECFRAEANDVFSALHTRIQRENLELYPLLERT